MYPKCQRCGLRKPLDCQRKGLVMYPKCQRCGSRFDPAFSNSSRLCGDCCEVVQGKPVPVLVGQSNTGLQADECPECRGLGYWVDTTALRVECRACSGSERAAKA
jgi:hypothetical protein